MKYRHLLLPFALLMLATMACGLVDEVLAPQPTFAPPPTVVGGVPSPTSAIEEAATVQGVATPTLTTGGTAPAITVEELGAPPETLEALSEWLSRAHSGGIELSMVCQVLRGAAWQQADDSCQEADLDGDEEGEWLLTLDTSSLEESATLQGHPGDFWIVGEEGVVYMERGLDNPDFFGSAPTLLELADMTGDELPEAITVFTTCGAHTCFSNYQIISAHDGPIANIVQLPEETEVVDAEPLVIALSYVEEERVEDVNDDSLPDLVIRGGIVGSAGAGLQRQRTEVWSWDGEAIVLAEQEWEETGIRFHHLYNANYAFEQEAYDVAAEKYEEVVVDPELEDVEWAGADAEALRTHVRQFAGFRLALLPLLRGDITEATRWRNWLQSEYPEAPLTRAATLLLAEWEANGNDLEAACTTVTSFLEGTDSPTGPLSDMGYNNPALEAADVCPMR